MSEMTDDISLLLEMLSSPVEVDRTAANFRLGARAAELPAFGDRLLEIASTKGHRGRYHALALTQYLPFSEKLWQVLMLAIDAREESPGFRAWAYRALGDLQMPEEFARRMHQAEFFKRLEVEEGIVASAVVPSMAPLIRFGLLSVPELLSWQRTTRSVSAQRDIAKMFPLHPQQDEIRGQLDALVRTVDERDLSPVCLGIKGIGADDRLASSLLERLIKTSGPLRNPLVDAICSKPQLLSLALNDRISRYFFAVACGLSSSEDLYRAVLNKARDRLKKVQPE